MILVVAEKPSVAATIATVLGATQKGVNYIYNDKYIVSWCLGHLVTLDDPDMYDKKYAEWKFENLPIIPNKWSFTINKTTKSQFYVLKNLFLKNDVTEIVCATDAGREGECISDMYIIWLVAKSRSKDSGHHRLNQVQSKKLLLSLKMMQSMILCIKPGLQELKPIGS